MKPAFHLLAAGTAAAMLTACGGSSDNHSPSTTSTVLSGVVQDGYISKALVFLDSNDNGIHDLGEPSILSDASGKYTLTIPAGVSTAHAVVALVQAGTSVDLDAPGTPVTQAYTMTAPVGQAAVISPLTTLLAARISAGQALDQATATIDAELGLAAGTSLLADYGQGGTQSADLHKFASATAEVLKSVTAASATGNTGWSDTLATITTQYGTQVLAYAATIRAAADPAAAAAVTDYAINFKPATLTAAACAALQGSTLPASGFTLATGGATITSATFVSATDSGNLNGNFCKVLGAINPSTTSGNVALGAATVNPAIIFEVNLPATWNGRFVHQGGGGFDGTLADGSTGTPGPNGLSRLDFAPPTSATPLAQGYMTFGSDSGHQSTSITNGTFAVNDEALANYGRLDLKKTEDAALSLMRSVYQVPRQLKGYFVGSSTGGRDGLAMIQNWPGNYDAIFVNRPALNYTGLRLSNIQLARSLWLDGTGAASPAGWINSYKTTVLMNAVMSACDGLDGLQDGIISNLDACKAKADSTLTSIRCAGGADTGNSCLSDAQIVTVRTMASPVTLNGYALANGVTSYGGYNILAGMVFGGPAVTYCANPALNVPAYGSPYASRDFGPSATGPVLSSTGQFSTLFSNWCATSAGGSAGNSPNAYQTGSEWAKYFIARQTTNFDPRRLDPATGQYAGTPAATKSGTTYAATPATSYAQRIADVSAMTDATSTDLDAFIAKGGKIIWTHGSADEVVSTDSSVAYYQQLVARYGQAKVDSFVRFYIINGNGHGDTGPFIPVFDSLQIVRAWAEGNVDPADNLVMGNEQVKSALDSSPGGTAQRPLCRYPSWPKYGGGDSNLAASFSCALQ